MDPHPLVPEVVHSLLVKVRPLLAKGHRPQEPVMDHLPKATDHPKGGPDRLHRDAQVCPKALPVQAVCLLAVCPRVVCLPTVCLLMACPGMAVLVHPLATSLPSKECPLLSASDLAPIGQACFFSLLSVASVSRTLVFLPSPSPSPFLPLSGLRSLFFIYLPLRISYLVLLFPLYTYLPSVSLSSLIRVGFTLSIDTVTIHTIGTGLV